jgi:hypothetical protein
MREADGGKWRVLYGTFEFDAQFDRQSFISTHEWTFWLADQMRRELDHTWPRVISSPMAKKPSVLRLKQSIRVHTREVLEPGSRV